MNLWGRFDPARPGSVVVAAALVGVAAGLVAAAFLLVTAEPWVDRAIAIEEAAADPDDDDDEEVARVHQKGVGLFAAYGLTGAAFGLIFAATFLGLRRGQPDVLRRSLAAGTILAGAFTVSPWVKYPPNPPAVGDPDTLSQRQWQYVAVIFFTFLVLLAAARLSGRLRASGWVEDQRLAAVALAGLVPLLVLWAVLPPAPDDITVPANLLWHFRLASLGGNLLLWGILALGFGALAAGAQRRSSARTTDGSAQPANTGLTAT